MAKIFNEGDEVTKEWLNTVSKTVTDGLGDKVSPGEIRVHINAEQAGAASAVQSKLDSHKNTSNIHFTVSSLNLGDKIDDDEKGAPEGVAPLDINSKVPATFLPSTGGYANTYTTQALMVADGATHLNGQVFLVTADPTSANDGEYTATVDAPTVIGDYYFNSGSVPAHGHAATGVSQTAGGTVQDFIDDYAQDVSDTFDTKLDGFLTSGELEEKSTGFDCNSQITNSEFSIDQSVLNYPDGMGGIGLLVTRRLSDIKVTQRVYDANTAQAWRRQTNNDTGDWSVWASSSDARTTKYTNSVSGIDATNVQDAIDEISLGTVDPDKNVLYSDGSVPMAGSYSPELGQDLATKTSSEAVFNERMGGIDRQDLTTHSGGVLKDFPGDDLNTLTGYGEWRFTTDGSVQNYPPILEGTTTHYCTIENHYRSASRWFQVVRATGNVSSEFYRSTDSGGGAAANWSEWVRVSNAANHQYDNTLTNLLTATRVQGAIDELAVDVAGKVAISAQGGANNILLKAWAGTQANYDAFTADPNTVYFITG